MLYWNNLIKVYCEIGTDGTVSELKLLFYQPLARMLL